MIPVGNRAEGLPARQEDTTTITASGASATLDSAADEYPAVWPYRLSAGWRWSGELTALLCPRGRCPEEDAPRDH